MKPSTILLADDHGVVIEGLRRMLDRPEFKIVGVAADGRALLEAVSRLRPDIIITDVAMPLLNGIDAAREILMKHPESKIIFFTMHSEVAYANAALAAGALGYVLKSGDQLIQAIEAALNGRTYLCTAIADAVERAREVSASEKRGAIDGLTPRQREVLQLLAEGRQAKEIAAVLKVSPKTVEFHKYRIMDATGARTIAELARYAIKHGIVT